MCVETPWVVRGSYGVRTGCHESPKYNTCAKLNFVGSKNIRFTARICEDSSFVALKNTHKV